jgi:hypothetical protein
MSTTERAQAAVGSVARLPTVDEVDRIAAMEAGPIRNLRITHTYHRLASAFRALAPDGVNWCGFAVWASKQAGQTIRGEDLPDLLRQELDPPPEVAGRITRLWRRLIRRAMERPRTRLDHALREVCDPGEVFRRTGEAVSAGNHLVFAEIGREFARFLHECGPGPVSGEALARFLDGLRPGDLPHGQELLRQAFTHLVRAMAAVEARERAEWMLLANLEIGLHEQTRLQPEIAAALDAPLATLRGRGERLLAVLFPPAAKWPKPARLPLEGALSGAGWVAQRMVGRVVRAAVTEAMMRLTFPGGLTVRIGRDPGAEFPESLREPRNGELVALLARFRPAANDPDGAGACDWSVLEDRMQLIARVFHLYQENLRLYEPPFTPDQVRQMETGVLPDGAL